MTLSSSKAISSPYVFDFDTEVAYAKAMYPEETKDIGFLNLSAPDAKKQVYGWVNKNVVLWEKMLEIFASEVENPNDQLDVKLIKLRQTPKIYEVLQSTEKKVNEAAMKMYQSDTHCFPANKFLFKRPCLVHRYRPSGDLLPDPEKNAFFTFYHELGHLLVKGASGIPDVFAKTKKDEEDRADIFSLIHGLKRQILTPDDIKHVANFRLFWLLTGDDVHFTTQTINGLNVKSGFYTPLSPQEIKHLADKHSRTFTTPDSRFKKIRPLIDEFQRAHGDMIKSIAETRGAVKNGLPHAIFSNGAACDALKTHFDEVRKRHSPSNMASIISREILNSLTAGKKMLAS